MRKPPASNANPSRVSIDQIDSGAVCDDSKDGAREAPPDIYIEDDSKDLNEESEANKLYSIADSPAIPDVDFLGEQDVNSSQHQLVHSRSQFSQTTTNHVKRNIDTQA